MMMMMMTASNWMHFIAYGMPSEHKKSTKWPATLCIWDGFDNISRFFSFFSEIIEIGRRINLTYLLTADVNYALSTSIPNHSVTVSYFIACCFVWGLANVVAIGNVSYSSKWERGTRASENERNEWKIDARRVKCITKRWRIRFNGIREGIE